MTATERLRQLLDERGVEWKAAKAPLPVTSWHGAHSFKFTAMNPYGVTDYLLVQTNTLDEWPHLTPEQAVEATLGRGTCDLQAENDKLRELIADMWRFTGAACKKYPRLFDQSAQGGQMVYPNMIDSFEQRMAELGVEVES